MTEPLQVGQFAIVDHEPVDRGPNAGIFHGKGPVDDRAELYILAEGTTPAGESFAGHVVSAAGHAWQTLDMSLTGAIRRMFSEASGSLRDWNQKSIAQHRVSIGMACLARRGSQAVIAQCGPSVVFHRSATGIDAYFPDEEHGRPLGAGPRAADPQLHRIDFAPGDRVLMISTAALREIDDETVDGILELPAHQVLANLFRRLAHLRDVTTLFVMAPGPQPVAALAAAEEPIIGAATPPLDFHGEIAIGLEEPASFQPSLFIEDSPENKLARVRQDLVEISSRARQTAVALPEAMEIPEPLQRAVGENVLVRLAAEGRARAAAAEAGVPRPLRAGSAEPGRTRLNASEGRRIRRKDSFIRGLVHEERPPVPLPPSEHAPLAADLADEIRGRPVILGDVSATIATESASTLSGGGALVRMRGQMGGRWKGGGAIDRRTAFAFRRPSPSWLVILGGLGVLLLVVGLIAVPRLIDSGGGARYAELIDEAQQKLAVARAVEDPAERRTNFTSAQALLLEARDLSGQDTEAADLLDQVNASLSEMDAIAAPIAVEPIASLEQFGDKPVAATSLTITPTTAFVLDGASGQVIALALDGSSHTVVYGEDAAAGKGRPVAMAWLDAGDLGEPSLLVVDNAKKLWAYSSAQGLRPVPFAVNDSLTVTDISVYRRDLYVLDAAASTVYRLSPGDGGYVNPVRVLASEDLAQARRLAVDGEILTADEDGTVHRFAGQLSLALSEAGIDERLTTAETPMPLAPDGEIAVLDPANNRIVVFRRDGSFDRQYRDKAFVGISAMTIRDSAAYIFANGKLSKVTW